MRPVCGHTGYSDGCAECKLYSVRLNTEGLKRANQGKSATMGMTDREYARSMYDIARAEGRPDPIPLNKESAAVAPAKGVFRKPTGV